MGPGVARGGGIRRRSARPRSTAAPSPWMASYRRRLEQDRGRLDRPRPGAGREPAGDPGHGGRGRGGSMRRRRWPSSAALMAGVAVIAFVAAEVGRDPPRIARFVLILAAFLGASGRRGLGRRPRPAGRQPRPAQRGGPGVRRGHRPDGADLRHRRRPAGGAARRAPALAAVLLALAGRSPWAAAVGIVLIAIGDFAGGRAFGLRTGWRLAGLRPRRWGRWRRFAGARRRWRMRRGCAAILAGARRSIRSARITQACSSWRRGACWPGPPPGPLGAGAVRGARGVLYGWFVWGALHRGSGWPASTRTCGGWGIRWPGSRCPGASVGPGPP